MFRGPEAYRVRLNTVMTVTYAFSNTNSFLHFKFDLFPICGSGSLLSEALVFFLGLNETWPLSTTRIDLLAINSRRFNDGRRERKTNPSRFLLSCLKNSISRPPANVLDNRDDQPFCACCSNAPSATHCYIVSGLLFFRRRVHIQNN